MRPTPASLPVEPRREPGVGCQLVAFPPELDRGPPSREEPWSWWIRRRARRATIRLRDAARRLLGGGPAGDAPGPFPAPALRAGDRVRVRSADEIRATLDAAGAYKGCGFGLGMYAWCGREARVAKVVERFFDEARGRMLRARNMVLLEGVHCDGASSPDTLGCDRMCLYFWRTEWLERIEAPAPRGEDIHGG
jgi:hypothetical protein